MAQYCIWFFLTWLLDFESSNVEGSGTRKGKHFFLNFME